MAKTPAERQAERRAKLQGQQCRLDTYISAEAKTTLDGLARALHMPQKDLLEHLIADGYLRLRPKLSEQQLDLFYDL